MRRIVLVAVLALLAGLLAPVEAKAATGSWRHLVTLPTRNWPTGVGLIQGAQWYPTASGADRWLVAQAENGSGKSGDAYFHRHGARGQYLDTMTLRNGGHPSQFAVRQTPDVLKVLVRWNRTPRWVVYRSRVRTVGQSRISRQPTPGISVAHVGLSENRVWLIARKQRGDGREEYALFRRANGSVSRVSRFVRNKPAVHQGFATDGRFIYVLYGKTNQRSFIQRLDARTGRLVDSLDVTSFRRFNVSREVEGLGWRKGRLLMGNREGGANRNRVFTVGEVRYAPWFV